MNWYEWTFNGIGTAIFSILAGLFTYKFVIKKDIQQTQKGKNNVKQIQNAILKNDNNEKNEKDNRIRQIQHAENNSIQIQTGGLDA